MFFRTEHALPDHMLREIRSEAKVNKLETAGKAEQLLHVFQNLTFDFCEWRQ
jgi:hypothetical protein